MSSKGTTGQFILRQLYGVAAKLTADVDFRKDLLQEMLVHLHRAQIKLPGRTVSWYIKSCEFHARNYLNRGRSVDSHKRASQLVSLDAEEYVETGFFSVNPADTCHVLMAQDLVNLITPKLSDCQKKVLQLLLNGCGVREAGRQLGISHPAVIKHRHRIARIAREVIADKTPHQPLAAPLFG
jgi:DNA-directed RNA polymerase specialized sigma24 family protein